MASSRMHSACIWDRVSSMLGGVCMSSRYLGISYSPFVDSLSFALADDDLCVVKALDGASHASLYLPEVW